MKKLASLFVLCMFAIPVFAGSANMTNIHLHGYGNSTTYSNGYDTVYEWARGYRHLDASGDGKTSVRNEYYTRSSYDNNQHHSTTHTSDYTVGSIMNATRVGESMFWTDSYSSTYGTSYASGGYQENGVFNAYDQVNDTYSYESGQYVAYGADYSTTYYNSHTYADVYSESAYAIYGAN